jgi:carbon-monoxide dehydrogenase medium subunit
MRPQGVAIAILNIAVWLKRQDDKIIDLHIAVGPSGPVPKRARAAEAVLRGAHLDRVTIEKAANALLDESAFRTSQHRASLEYRQRVAVNLLENALNIVWERSLVP